MHIQKGIVFIILQWHHVINRHWKFLEIGNIDIWSSKNYNNNKTTYLSSIYI